MSLQELALLDPVPAVNGVLDNEVNLGARVDAAILRNREAFAVARGLGQTSKHSMQNCPHIEDIAFRRHLLTFFCLGDAVHRR